ncbi:MAG: hypothetical protein PUK69_04030 [Clostridiales bacterium]|nr:hypothetical protein [Clostridiales bacterium]
MGAGISCAAGSSSFSFLFRRKEKQKEAKRKEKPDDVNKKPVEKTGLIRALMFNPALTAY